MALVKKMKLIPIFLVLLAAPFCLAAQGFAWTDKVESNGFVFSWKIEGESLIAEIEAPTTGWLSVGIDPSFMMKDADFIIAYVKDGQAVVRDDFGSGSTRHQADTSLGGSDNVRILESSELNGKTRIRFSIPLNSGDKYDKVISLGKQTKLIWAYGPNNADNFTAMHVKKGSFSVTFK